MQSILLRTGYGRLHNVYFFYTGYKLVTNGNLDFSLGFKLQGSFNAKFIYTATCISELSSLKDVLFKLCYLLLFDPSFFQSHF